MSDYAAIYDGDEREFRSPFDLGFDLAAIETIKWLVLGHLLYVAGMSLALVIGLGNGNVWMTPLFGLPLLWAGRREREWQRALVVVVGFTAAHALGCWVALRYNVGAEGSLIPGLAGGAAGAASALLLCWICGMLRPGAPTIVFACFGVLLLAAVGGFGVYMFQTSTGQGTFAGALISRLWLYTPWQLVFAYVLAKALNPVGT